MGGILTKKQSAALTLEAGIMNFLVLNPQVIPHRKGPSRQVLFGRRKKNFEMFFFSFYPYYQDFRRIVCLLGSRFSGEKKWFF